MAETSEFANDLLDLLFHDVPDPGWVVLHRKDGKWAKRQIIEAPAEDDDLEVEPSPTGKPNRSSVRQRTASKNWNVASQRLSTATARRWLGCVLG